jgi:hypothetical protein
LARAAGFSVVSPKDAGPGTSTKCRRYIVDKFRRRLTSLALRDGKLFPEP